MTAQLDKLRVLCGQRVARNISGDIKYYVTDHLHSTAMFVDKSGTVLDDNDFYPWGGAVPGVGQTTSTNHYKFTGKERDSETQLDYFGARYYANASGRWMSPDWAAKPVTVPYAEFGDPQSLNLYAYVRNSPIIRVDADGHNCVPMDTHVNTGGDGQPIDTTDELKMARQDALEAARAQQKAQSTGSPRINPMIHEARHSAPPAVPTHLTITALGGINPSTYTFTVLTRWSSSSGSLKDLARCTMGEYVIYPGRSPVYTWPYAMNDHNDNPTSLATPYTGAGGGFDQHRGPAGGFTKPYSEAHFDATQYITYACPSGVSGRLGPITITRSVGQDKAGTWQYTITLSSGLSAAAPLP